MTKNLLSNSPKPIGQILEKIGYSQGVSETPSMVTNSEGFQLALQETGLKAALEKQGINPAKIAEKIDVLLNAVDKEGVQDYNAIDKGLKHATAIYGITDDKPKNEGGNTYNFIFSKEVRQEVEAIDNRIKEMLIKSHVQEN